MTTESYKFLACAVIATGPLAIVAGMLSILFAHLSI